MGGKGCVDLWNESNKRFKLNDFSDICLPCLFRGLLCQERTQGVGGRSPVSGYFEEKGKTDKR